jgi:MFS family permease
MTEDVARESIDATSTNGAASVNGDASPGQSAPSATAVATPEARQTIEPPEPVGTFGAFRFPNYRLLWLGTAFGSAAMWIQQTTMGWVVFDHTGSGSLLGAVGSVGSLPTPFVAALAGVATDRFRRERIVAVSQFALFLNAAFLAAVIALDALEVWHLFLFAILAGVLNAINMPARQTLVFDTVPREYVPNAIALSNLAFSTMRAVGPMVGGALIVLFGPANNFLLQGLAYLCVMSTVFMIRLPPRSGAVQKRAVFRDMADGYSYTMRNPETRILLLMLVIYPLFIIPLHNALMPIFAKDVFHAGASGLGILLASIGVGGIIGGLMTASLNGVDRRGMLQLYALFVLSLSQALFCIVGGLTGSLWAAVIFLVTAGISGALFNTTNQTVLQLLAPDEMRGRITSVLQVHPICSSIGILLTGAAADLVGATAAGAGVSLMAFVAGAGVLLFSPRMRDLRLSRLAPVVDRRTGVAGL